jgi:hypothetical protein
MLLCCQNWYCPGSENSLEAPWQADAEVLKSIFTVSEIRLVKLGVVTHIDI